MATTKQRRRQLARQKYERQRARRQAGRRHRRMGLAIGVSIVMVGALVFALGAWWLPSGDDEPEAAADGDCQYFVTEPVEGISPPSADPPTAASATITIDGQPVTIALDADAARCTVGSFVHLAGQGYFDGTECHRLATSATLGVLQCGDPTGTGSGGPGYEFGLENVDGAVYTAGTVAMARRSGDPNSNGSQFFLVHSDSQLPPEYTVFGQITDGLDVITEIAQGGTADDSDDGSPAEAVTIDSVVAAP